MLSYSTFIALSPSLALSPSPTTPQAALQKAKKDIGELQANRPLALAAGHLKMSQLDQKGVRVVEEQADRLVDGGVVVLEKLHLKVRYLRTARGRVVSVGYNGGVRGWTLPKQCRGVKVTGGGYFVFFYVLNHLFVFVCGLGVGQY